MIDLMIYHGSKSAFDKFDYSLIGTNATSEGYGFYFTSNREIAEGYANGGYLYTAEFLGKKSLSSTKKTLTRVHIRKLMNKLHSLDDGYLWNYYDIDYYGLFRVLTKAVDLEYNQSDNDVDLICGIANAHGSKEVVLKELYNLFEYDHIHMIPEWGDQSLYIATVENAIRIVQVEGIQ